MIIKGRYKPHIYKYKGWWYALWLNQPSYRMKMAAKEHVDSLNREISKAQTNEK